MHWPVKEQEGGQEDNLKAAVKDVLERVGLTKFRHQPCGGYSGGMKRKLSFAVALIGEPPVLLLDELDGLEVVRPPHYDLANAIGAAIAQVSGEDSRVIALA